MLNSSGKSHQAHQRRRTFENWVFKYGSPRDDNIMHPSIEEYLDATLETFRGTIESHANDGPPMLPTYGVYADYVHNTSLNAVAFEVQGDEYIAVFTGAPIVISNAFMALLSCPTVFPSIGNTKDDATSNQHLCEYVNHPQNFPLYDLLPDDPIRELLAAHLAIIADLFLFSHEMGHLTRGHMLFLSQEGKESELLEYGANPESSVAPNTRRLMELAADAMAARFGIANWINFNANSETHHREFPHYFRLWSYALSIFWRLIDIYAPCSGHSLHDTHPEATVRLLNTQGWSSYEVATKCPELAPTFFEEMKIGEKEISDLWNRLGICSPTFCREDWQQNAANSLQRMSTALDKLEGLSQCQNLRAELVYQRLKAKNLSRGCGDPCEETC